MHELFHGASVWLRRRAGTVMTAREVFFVNRKYPDACPETAIDRLRDRGLNAIEISWELLIPIWVVQERFTWHAGQFYQPRLAS